MTEGALSLIHCQGEFAPIENHVRDTNITINTDIALQPRYLVSMTFELQLCRAK